MSREDIMHMASEDDILALRELHGEELGLLTRTQLYDAILQVQKKGGLNHADDEPFDSMLERGLDIDALEAEVYGRSRKSGKKR